MTNKTVSLVLERYVDGQYSVKVDDQTDIFTVTFSEVLRPASFIIESIEISPSTVRVDDPVLIAVSIFNNGDMLLL